MKNIKDKSIRKIVFVCQVFYPDDSSTSQLLTDLLKKFASSGHVVSVYCGFPKNKKNVPRYEDYNGIKINRYGLRISWKATKISRILSYFSYLAHIFFKLLFSPPSKNSFVLAVTNPPFMGIVLLFVYLINRISYNYLLHDVYPEGLIYLGKLKQNSFLVKSWRLLNRLSFQKASSVIVLGRDVKKLLKENYRITKNKIQYIPNWSSIEINKPIAFKNNQMAKRLQLENKFVIQYSGNMGLWHDMKTLIYAAGKLKEDNRIKFLFIGDGIRRKQAEDLAKELQLDNIIWLDFVQKNQLVESLSCCHVSLITLRENLEGIAVPSKIYGIMASGRAIIAAVPKLSEITFIVEEENCGQVIEPGDVDKLVETINQFLREPELVKQMGLNAFQAYQKKYTLNQAATSFKTLFESV
jgi:colanic acid biosynthesis glycosyl transferase WcaI